MRRRVFNPIIIIAASFGMGAIIGQAISWNRENKELRNVTYQRYFELLQKKLIARVTIFKPCNRVEAYLFVDGKEKKITIFPPFKKVHEELLKEFEIPYEVKSTEGKGPSTNEQLFSFCPPSTTDIDYIYFLEEIRKGHPVSIHINLKDDKLTPVVFGKMMDQDGEYQFRVNTAYPDNISVDSTYLEEIEKYNETNSSDKISVVRTNKITKDDSKFLKILYFLSAAAIILISLMIALSSKKKRALAPENPEKDDEVIASMEAGTDEALKFAGVTVVKEIDGRELSRIDRILKSIQYQGRSLRQLILRILTAKIRLREWFNRLRNKSKQK